MTYAICTAMYGIPLSDNVNERSNIMSEFVDSDLPGVETRYSGSAMESPAAFGVELSSMDEACHHTEISELVLEPSDDVIHEFNSLYDNLTDEIKEELAIYGPPRVFFLWSTS